MIVAYGTIGMFETIGAFFAWYWVYAAYGFSFNMLLGCGLEYS
jgi:hypothetical protein